jgi:hypothetical protein
MVIRPEEMALAREYVSKTELESLTDQQMKQIMDRGRVLFHWYREHQAFHYLINLLVLTLLLGGDYLVLARLPGVFLQAGGANPLLRLLLVGCLCGSLHSWLLYSLAIFSMHEGAAHHIIFSGRGKVSRAMDWVASNLCRIALSEPSYYSEHHMSHHAKFGTEGDGEFLNFVLPRRYWLTWLPFAAFLNYTDFVAHRPPNYTRSRIISGIVSVCYHGAFAWFLGREYGWLYVLFCFILFLTRFGFVMDRLRQFTEHNMMPLENKDGSRSLGFGFWGMLIGGGPWGSPCHWEHHLVASLPWYQQLVLHRFVVRRLTREQRKQFLIEPVIGYPKLLWRLWTEPNRFARTAEHHA